MKGAPRLLPGTTGRNLPKRIQDPEVSAAMILDEFETWLVHQIAGVYHRSVHRSCRLHVMLRFAELSAIRCT